MKIEGIGVLTVLHWKGPIVTVAHPSPATLQNNYCTRVLKSYSTMKLVLEMNATKTSVKERAPQ